MIVFMISTVLAGFELLLPTSCVLKPTITQPGHVIQTHVGFLSSIVTVSHSE